jgi:UDP-N-acetylmuramoyl-tripeptide--D-alanyl-D-alanine ligase
MIGMEFNELLSVTGGTIGATSSAAIPGRIGRVVTDSRSVESGDVFVALPGGVRDGVEFLPDAAKRGAVAAIVGASGGRYPGLVCVRVEDSLQALWALAAWNRDRCHALRVAVTGSFAKTTTRQMIQRVLSHVGRTHQSPGNYNNDVGVPLSLLGLSAADEFGVFELAASGGGEIGPLSKLVQPSAGVLTGFGRAHLGGFGTFEAVVREKSRMLESVAAGGLIVVPAECVEHLGQTGAGGRLDCLRGDREWVTVGVEAEADIVASDVEHNSGELNFAVDGQRFRIPVAGRHFVVAALSAVAVARWQGIGDSESAAALSTFRTSAGRCRVERTAAGTVIDDSYNASPESMLAACRVLSEWSSPGRRVLVLGDMSELGEQAAVCHGELGAEVARSGRIDRLWAAGWWAESTVGAAIEAGMPRESTWSGESVEQLLDSLPGLLEPGDTVLVKGARRTRMERVVEWFCEVSQPVRVGRLNH